MSNLRVSLSTVASILLVAGCSDVEPPHTSSRVEAVMYASSLVAEGACQWLTCCSSFSTGPYAAGTAGTFVCPGYAPYDQNKGRAGICDPNLRHNDATQAWAPSFACGGTDLNCDSNAQQWLSGPVSACGGDWVICYNGTQTHTYIKDHADSNGLWEASYGLLNAVGSGSNIVHIYDSPNDPNIATDPMCGTICTPNCSGKSCGPDGCNGSCGTCTPPYTCNSYGNCECVGTAVGQCGWTTDTCGNQVYLGDCPGGQVCQSNYCCTPCAGQTCGTDLSCGTGASCGSCTPPYTCNSYGNCECVGTAVGQCGWTTDTCGNQVYLGDCPAGQVCQGNWCVQAGPVCGNGSCEAGEDCSNCPADCGSCGPVCGNGVCEGGEDCSNCPSDCGACPGCGCGGCGCGGCGCGGCGIDYGL